jgi:signal transduction histidine kinase/ActR/RegA family two-component response regulator
MPHVHRYQPPRVNRHRHRSVRTFLTWLVLACLLPGVIGAVFLFLHQYRQALAQQETQVLQTTRALVQAVDNHLLTGQALAQALSTSDSLAEENFARFHQRARESIALSGLGTNIVLRTQAGEQVLNTAVDFGEPLPTAAFPEQVREVFETGKPTVSDVFVGPVLKRPLVSVDVPILRDGEIVYALGVGILPEHFNRTMKTQALPAGWVAAVLDSSGTIAGRTHSADQFVGRKAVPALLDQVMASLEGSGVATTQEGTPVLSFHTRSPVTGWSVAIGIPHQAMHAALGRPLTLLALGMAALFATSLMLAWLVGGRIARSVTALTAPASALGEGQALAVPPVHLKEAAEVGRAIERAADLLREREATIAAREAEVAEAHALARFGTWTWDVASGEVHTSASVPRIYGREVPPFPEQRGTLLSVESWDRVNEAQGAMAHSGSSYDLELQVNHGSGRTIWINAKGEAVKNEQGDVVSLRGTIQDITERKTQAEALQKSRNDALQAARQADAERRQLDAVLEAVPVGIIVAGAGGLPQKENPAHARLWGRPVSMSQRLGAHEPRTGWWADGSVRHGRRIEAHEWALARALRGEDAPHDVIEIETFDTPPLQRIVITSGAPIRDASGTIIGAVVAVMDITDQVRAEHELRQADRRKDEFLAMLAHELRNPLAPIAAAADLLRLPGADASRVAHASTVIARQVRHMTGLIDDLLDVSRVTRGLVKLERQKLDAVRILADAVEQARPLIEARAHRLIVDTPPQAAFVFGDQKRLVQAITNLLNNAAKFTPTGGEIALRAEVDNEHVKISVTDSGIGMAPELVERAFELFGQGERTADRSQGGLGIGLALVKSLTELHGGTASASSAGTDRGSRFVVCLPRMIEEVEVAESRQDPVSVQSSDRALKVLVVDDNADAAQMLAMFVEALGHTVSVELSALAGLRRARAELPHVCLLDIGLPEMDGNELARRLRSQPAMADSVLIAVTGYGQESDRERSVAAGFDHHLIKPVDTNRLASILDELVDRLT